MNKVLLVGALLVVLGQAQEPEILQTFENLKEVLHTHSHDEHHPELMIQAGEGRRQVQQPLASPLETQSLYERPAEAYHPFEDQFTRENNAASKNCRGRLPNLLGAEDLEFFAQLNKGAYLKYMDQISLFRALDSILTFQKGQLRPLREVRCLFESPCMLTRGINNVNFTMEVCTGDKIQFETRVGRDGLMESVIRNQDGSAGLELVVVPAFTDRRSYVTLINCMADGSLGFMVISNRAGLSPYTRHQIKEQLDESGFNDNFRISTSFMSSSCKNRI